MSKITHIVGPPGTGKTETLAKSTREAVTLRGRRVLVVSLTNTAAREIRDRTGLQDRSMCWVGTLHRGCMDSLGVTRDELTVSHLAEWNEERCEGRPSWRVTPQEREEPFSGDRDETFGDRVLGAAERQRQRNLEPRGVMGEAEAGFWEAFCAWKSERGLWDFTDLLERAVEDDVAPLRHLWGESPEALCIDEAQDCTPLELRLVREVWATQVEHTILAGDADQSLYGFRYADPAIFMGEASPHVLSQSYRVPRAVHAVAQRIIRRIGDRRLDVQYAPRDAEGEVLRPPWSARDGEAWLPALEAWQREGTVMILGATRYTVAPLVRTLREAGLPYHNPWRPDRGDWNPLGARRGKSTKDRLLAYLDPEGGDWSCRDLRLWLPLLRAKGVLRHGMMRQVRAIFPDADVPYGNDVFVGLWENGEDEAIRALEREPAWILERCATKVERVLRTLERFYRWGGVQALRDEPRITVGTVHSVKGASADTVVVLPDITWRMWKAQGSVAEMDAQTRTFYVACTRARERLVLAQPSGRLCYEL